MIRSLRHRFLLIAMFSLALTLFVIGGSINLGNYIRLTDRADAIITTLYENDWNFPFVRNHPNVSGRFQLTRETEFETRYCIIHLDENEKPSDVNSEHIASLSESDISALTDAILSSGKDNGYWGYYRYHLYPSDGSSESDSGTLVIVDCFSQLQSFYILLRLTFFIIFGCLAVVLLLLLCLSDYVIKPFADNIKKQRRFITDVSHELKTPLAILNANLSVLEENGAESVDSQKQWISAMRVQITRMSGLISDMLTLAKLDHDQDASPTRTVDFSRLVTGCLLSFEAVAYEKGVAIHSQVSEHLLVRGSPEKFSRLVDILLDNAVKHAPPGGTVNIGLFREKNRVILRVQNSGEEISAEALPHVFDRFYRADSARSRETGGYGLGLAIAKSIVEGSHGKISVESTNGHTIFSVDFSMDTEAHANL